MKINLLSCTVFGLAILLFQACSQNRSKLPILGQRTPVSRDSAGKSTVDTIYQTVPDFKMIDQNGHWVSNETFSHKIYVADFFFTSCPSICPVMQRNMLKIARVYPDEPKLNFLSYSIDPSHDNVAVLKAYSTKLGAPAGKWFFLTGNRDSIYELAEHGYYATAKADATAPGGFVHSGGLILVDSHRHIRGIYDGTMDEEVEKLGQDVRLLLDEENQKK